LTPRAVRWAWRRGLAMRRKRSPKWMGCMSVPKARATRNGLAATSGEVRIYPHEWPCIRCGDCALVCPSRLLPQDLLVAATTSDFDALATLGLQDCIECGCCDVICPSHIMLTERFRIAKRAVATHEPIAVTTPGQE